APSVITGSWSIETIFSPDELVRPLWGCSPASSTTNRFFIRTTGSSGLRMFMGGTSIEYIPVPGQPLVAASGGWTHAVVTYDKPSSTAKFYLDGVPVLTGTVSWTPPANWLFRVGLSTWEDATWYKGYIDEL